MEKKFVRIKKTTEYTVNRHSTWFNKSPMDKRIDGCLYYLLMAFLSLINPLKTDLTTLNVLENQFTSKVVSEEVVE